MTLAQPHSIIRQAGGGSFALDYASELMKKINNVVAHKTPASYLTQFSKSRDAGDLRGRLLEINLVNYFYLKNVPLRYEAKQQGVSGDVDLLWNTNGVDVYIEVKLLGQDLVSKKAEDAQLSEYGLSSSRIADDTSDVMRLQHTIIDKATLKKFEYPPAKNNINLIAIDVSELQLGTADAADCVLSTLGSKQVQIHFGTACARNNVLGLFELESKEEQREWADHVLAKLAGNPHPREYIHGVIFMFRSPKERAALSYEIKACIAWNDSLIDRGLMKKINTDFHKIVPFGW